MRRTLLRRADDARPEPPHACLRDWADELQAITERASMRTTDRATQVWITQMMRNLADDLERRGVKR